MAKDAIYALRSLSNNFKIQICLDVAYVIIRRDKWLS